MKAKARTFSIAIFLFFLIPLLAACRPECGDGSCMVSYGESAHDCPIDCAGTCGDKICNNYYESATTCKYDCGTYETGDSECSYWKGEKTSNSEYDCPGYCGDGICTKAEEIGQTCNIDCLEIIRQEWVVSKCEEIEPNVFEYSLIFVIVYEGDIVEQSDELGPVTGEWQPGCTPTSSLCGDGTCQSHENSLNCPGDCGTACGDGACNGGEDCRSCSKDCGECSEPPEPVCGDGVCNGDEICETCEADCGVCEPQ